MTSLLPCNFVFYPQGQFPRNWNAVSEGERSRDIRSLVSNLSEAPLFGTASFLGPRYYTDGALRQVSFLRTVRDEPVFFWDKANKRQGVTELDRIVVRGAQFVEGKWVVYYSISDCPNTPIRLYGVLYEIFQQYVNIHNPIEDPRLVGYDRVIGGPGLSSALERILGNSAREERQPPS